MTTLPVLASFTAEMSAPVAPAVTKPVAPAAPVPTPVAKPTDAAKFLGGKYKAKTPSAQDIADIEKLVSSGGRNDVIKAIREALKKRTGKAWSATGGRGTAYGWIRIEAAPARRTWGVRLKAGSTTTRPDDYESYNTGTPGGSMSPADQSELAAVLGLDRSHNQGESIPASNDYRKVYLCRARFGTAGPFTASQYWD